MLFRFLFRPHSVLKMLSVWLNKYLERDFFFHDRGNRLFDQLLKFLKVIQERDHSEQANKLKLLILKVGRSSSANGCIKHLN